MCWRESAGHAVNRTLDILARLTRPITIDPQMVCHGMQAVVSLPVQYRMAEDIQEVANTLFYDHALRCGTPGVAAGALALPPAAAGLLPSLPEWLQQVR